MENKIFILKEDTKEYIEVSSNHFEFSYNIQNNNKGSARLSKMPYTAFEISDIFIIGQEIRIYLRQQESK